MSADTAFSILIPAHDEGRMIQTCLGAVLASGGAVPGGEVIVIANACQDNTAARARDLAPAFAARNWVLSVLETETPGKLNALNRGDATAAGRTRIYLDADVTVSPDLIAELIRVLDTDQPRYATGSPVIARADSMVSRAYARFWERLPFVAEGTPGFGVFAVNATGRRRWQDWPEIISDDIFARLNFDPTERIRVGARYTWPPVEGFANLVRVRRRQDAGVDQIARTFPNLMRNEDKGALGLVDLGRRALRDPAGFGVYAGVRLGVRSPLFASTSDWARGR